VANIDDVLINNKSIGYSKVEKHYFNRQKLREWNLTNHLPFWIIGKTNTQVWG